LRRTGERSAVDGLDDQCKITNSSAEGDPDLSPFFLLFVLEAALHKSCFGECPQTRVGSGSGQTHFVFFG
jgi:hypothetical protein